MPEYTLYIKCDNALGELKRSSYAISDAHAVAMVEKLLPLVVKIPGVYRITFAQAPYKFIRSWRIKNHRIKVEDDELELTV